uniref:Uncharacterized protein n=1 Tax=Candidatus Kentrum sp. FW TaxID=2126338 RepID=A0A450TGX3_9GAMM|nr:MAG: hypothetical protein BECKFW1821B_GA0114236_11167 [Candidatus Kentron sp. FW]
MVRPRQRPSYERSDGTYVFSVDTFFIPVDPIYSCGFGCDSAALEARMNRGHRRLSPSEAVPQTNKA